MEDNRQSATAGERIRTIVRERPSTAAIAVLLIVAVAVIAFWAIWADGSPVWTGFGAYDEATAGPRAKTLWDWLGLLIIPVVLSGGVFWLNQSQRETEMKIAEKARAAEREIANSRQYQATLEAYYDRMTELLLKHSLRESAADSEVRSIALTRTIGVVKSLDGVRIGQLFAFLKASKLMERDSPIIDPAGADFSGANMSGADLGEVFLARADLHGANLTGANLFAAGLSGADLNGADLSRANLSGADLTGANLREANLTGANLSRAKLNWADLRGADLRGADLLKADLSGADLSGTINLSIEQVERAGKFEDTIMPWDKSP